MATRGGISIATRAPKTAPLGPMMRPRTSPGPCALETRGAKTSATPRITGAESLAQRQNELNMEERAEYAGGRNGDAQSTKLRAVTALCCQCSPPLAHIRLAREQIETTRALRFRR